MKREKAERSNPLLSAISHRTLPIIFVLLLIHVLLLFFAGSNFDQRFLFLFFFSILVMLPGFISAKILFPGARLYLKLFLSLIIGPVPFFMLLILFSILDLNIFYISLIIPALCIGLSIYHDRRSFVGFELPYNQALSAHIVILMCLILVLISIITLGIKDPILYTGDSPDNMAYIRTITRSHEVFPDQFMYKDGGLLTRDLRRGLLHAMWGTINTATSRTDVFPIWPFLSWIGSIFVLLGIFFLGVQLFRNQTIGILGVILYILFYQGGLAGHQLVINAYSFFFAKTFLFAFMAFVPLYLRTNRKEFLLLAVFSSFVAVGTHVSYIMILLFITFIFSLMELFETGKESRVHFIVRILLPLFASIVAANLPYLLLRYFRDYNPVNEIHTHVQGMLFFTEHLAVVNPILFFQRTGYLMGSSLLAVFILWNSSRSDRNLRSFLVLVAAVYILAFNPLWVPFIMDKITYLIIRFSVAAPSMLVVAYLLRSLWQRSRRKIDYPSRPLTIFGWLIVIVFLLPGLISNFTGFAYGGKSRDIREERSCLDLNDLYSVLNNKITAGSVIASDPFTCYSLLAFTDQYVVCTFDQHSTPNDSTAIERIIACRDIYLPGGSRREKILTLDKYSADYVVINGRIPTDVRSQYWRPDRKSAEAAALELSQFNELFELIYSSESLYLFEYKDSTDSIAAEMDGKDGERPRFVLEEFTGDYGLLKESGTDGIYIRSWGKAAERISRGDTLRIHVDWVTDKKLEPGTYLIYVRFDTDFEKGPLYSARYGKIYRKIVEKINGETYRFRDDILPFEGIYPPDKWNPGEVLRDYIDVPIPGHISDGVYTISIKMDNAPHYSNLRMKDLLRDDDFYDGPDLMEIAIE